MRRKNPVFRVTRPYLKLLLKPRFFFQILWKKMILCILKGKMPLKMHKIIFFREKLIKKQIVYLSYLNVSVYLP